MEETPSTAWSGEPGLPLGRERGGRESDGDALWAGLTRTLGFSVRRPSAPSTRGHGRLRGALWPMRPSARHLIPAPEKVPGSQGPQRMDRVRLDPRTVLGAPVWVQRDNPGEGALGGWDVAHQAMCPSMRSSAKTASTGPQNSKTHGGLGAGQEDTPIGWLRLCRQVTWSTPETPVVPQTPPEATSAHRAGISPAQCRVCTPKDTLHPKYQKHTVSVTFTSSFQGPLPVCPY